VPDAYNQGVWPLAKIIQDAREARGLSQTELGAAVGTGQQAVSKWETGEARPRPKSIPRLADALRLSPTLLLAAAGYIDASAEEWTVDVDDWVKYRYREDHDASPAKAAEGDPVLRALSGDRALNEEDRRYVMDLVERLRGRR
jgi:transcriptional regulator with XRE-family HTH domain